MNNQPQSEIIGKILAPALELWLKSLVDQTEALQIQISGSDRFLLRGCLPSTSVACRRTVYRGLHFSQILLESKMIYLNLLEIFCGKPLRLLEPIQVDVHVVLAAEDLTESLSSSLFSQALTDLLVNLLNHSSKNHLQIKNAQIDWQEAVLNSEQITFLATLRDHINGKTSITLSTGLEAVNRHTLRLYPLQIKTVPEQFSFKLREFYVDLSSKIEFKTLTLASDQLICSGSLTVVP